MQIPIKKLLNNKFDATKSTIKTSIAHLVVLSLLVTLAIVNVSVKNARADEETDYVSDGNYTKSVSPLANASYCKGQEFNGDAGVDKKYDNCLAMSIYIDDLYQYITATNNLSLGENVDELQKQLDDILTSYDNIGLDLKNYKEKLPDAKHFLVDFPVEGKALTTFKDDNIISAAEREIKLSADQIDSLHSQANLFLDLNNSIMNRYSIDTSKYSSDTWFLQCEAEGYQLNQCEEKWSSDALKSSNKGDFKHKNIKALNFLDGIPYDDSLLNGDDVLPDNQVPLAAQSTAKQVETIQSKFSQSLVEATKELDDINKKTAALPLRKRMLEPAFSPTELTDADFDTLDEAGVDSTPYRQMKMNVQLGFSTANADPIPYAKDKNGEMMTISKAGEECKDIMQSAPSSNEAKKLNTCLGSTKDKKYLPTAISFQIFTDQNAVTGSQEVFNDIANAPADMEAKTEQIVLADAANGAIQNIKFNIDNNVGFLDSHIQYGLQTKAEPDYTYVKTSNSTDVYKVANKDSDFQPQIRIEKYGLSQSSFRWKIDQINPEHPEEGIKSKDFDTEKVSDRESITKTFPVGTIRIYLNVDSSHDYTFEAYAYQEFGNPSYQKNDFHINESKTKIFPDTYKKSSNEEIQKSEITDFSAKLMGSISKTYSIEYSSTLEDGNVVKKQNGQVLPIKDAQVLKTKLRTNQGFLSASAHLQNSNKWSDTSFVTTNTEDGSQIIQLGSPNIASEPINNIAAQLVDSSGSDIRVAGSFTDTGITKRGEEYTGPGSSALVCTGLINPLAGTGRYVYSESDNFATLDPDSGLFNISNYSGDYSYIFESDAWGCPNSDGFKSDSIMGHPVLGDIKYGTGDAQLGNRRMSNKSKLRQVGYKLSGSIQSNFSVYYRIFQKNPNSANGYWSSWVSDGAMVGDGQSDIFAIQLQLVSSEQRINPIAKVNAAYYINSGSYSAKPAISVWNANDEKWEVTQCDNISNSIEGKSQVVHLGDYKIDNINKTKHEEGKGQCQNLHDGDYIRFGVDIAGKLHDPLDTKMWSEIFQFDSSSSNSYSYMTTGTTGSTSATNSMRVSFGNTIDSSDIVSEFTKKVQDNRLKQALMFTVLAVGLAAGLISVGLGMAGVAAGIVFGISLTCAVISLALTIADLILTLKINSASESSDFDMSSLESEKTNSRIYDSNKNLFYVHSFEWVNYSAALSHKAVLHYDNDAGVSGKVKSDDCLDEGCHRVFINGAWRDADNNVKGDAPVVIPDGAKVWVTDGDNREARKNENTRFEYKADANRSAGYVISGLSWSRTFQLVEFGESSDVSIKMQDISNKARKMATDTATTFALDMVFIALSVVDICMDIIDFLRSAEDAGVIKVLGTKIPKGEKTTIYGSRVDGEAERQIRAHVEQHPLSFHATEASRDYGCSSESLSDAIIERRVPDSESLQETFRNAENASIGQSIETYGPTEMHYTPATNYRYPIDGVQRIQNDVVPHDFPEILRGSDLEPKKGQGPMLPATTPVVKRRFSPEIAERLRNPKDLEARAYSVDSAIREYPITNARSTIGTHSTSRASAQKILGVELEAAEPGTRGELVNYTSVSFDRRPPFYGNGDDAYDVGEVVRFDIVIPPDSSFLNIDFAGFPNKGMLINERELVLQRGLKIEVESKSATTLKLPPNDDFPSGKTIREIRFQVRITGGMQLKQGPNVLRVNKLATELEEVARSVEVIPQGAVEDIVGTVKKSTGFTLPVIFHSIFEFASGFSQIAKSIAYKTKKIAEFANNVQDVNASPYSSHAGYDSPFDGALSQVYKDDVAPTGSGGQQKILLKGVFACGYDEKNIDCPKPDHNQIAATQNMNILAKVIYDLTHPSSDNNYFESMDDKEKLGISNYFVTNVINTYFSEYNMNIEGFESSHKDEIEKLVSMSLQAKISDEIVSVLTSIVNSLLDPNVNLSEFSVKNALNFDIHYTHEHGNIIAIDSSDGERQYIPAGISNDSNFILMQQAENKTYTTKDGKVDNVPEAIDKSKESPYIAVKADVFDMMKANLENSGLQVYDTVYFGSEKYILLKTPEHYLEFIKAGPKPFDEGFAAGDYVNYPLYKQYLEALKAQEKAQWNIEYDEHQPISSGHDKLVNEYNQAKAKTEEVLGELREYVMANPTNVQLRSMVVRKGLAQSINQASTFEEKQKIVNDNQFIINVLYDSGLSSGINLSSWNSLDVLYGFNYTELIKNIETTDYVCNNASSQSSSDVVLQCTSHSVSVVGKHIVISTITNNTDQAQAYEIDAQSGSTLTDKFEVPAHSNIEKRFSVDNMDETFTLYSLEELKSAYDEPTQVGPTIDVTGWVCPQGYYYTQGGFCQIDHTPVHHDAQYQKDAAGEYRFVKVE